MVEQERVCIVEFVSFKDTMSMYRECPTSKLSRMSTFNVCDFVLWTLQALRTAQVCNVSVRPSGFVSLYRRHCKL